MTLKLHIGRVHSFPITFQQWLNSHPTEPATVMWTADCEGPKSSFQPLTPFRDL